MTLRVLEGLRVISIEQFIAAPYCTQILADAGAHVLKVERPDVGDPRRSYDPVRHVGDAAISGGFASYNRGKDSIALDLSLQSDRESLHVLLGDADVLVSNLRPGALGRLELDPVTLRTRYPSLVICEITGFGVTGGPLADLTAFDSVIQAMSGLSGLIGSTADDQPGLAPMSTMDLLTGIWAALGISMALVQRSRTGAGAHIDAAMFDIGAALLERPLTLHEFTGEVPTRGTDRFSPVGAFRAVDGRWLSIVIPTEEMWRRCCTAIDRRDLIADSRLDSTLKRAEHMHDLVLPALESWARSEQLAAEAAAARLRQAGQPVGIVQSIDEVRGSEQLEHRGLFAPLLVTQGDSVMASGLQLPRMPLLFDGVGATPGPVPDLDNHSSHQIQPNSKRSRS